MLLNKAKGAGYYGAGAKVITRKYVGWGWGLDLRGIGLYGWKIIDGTGEGGGVRGLRWIYKPITRMPAVAGLISMVIMRVSEI